jgi:hypothetical protein
LPTLSLLVDDHSRSAFSLFLVGSINHAHNIILLCKREQVVSSVNFLLLNLSHTMFFVAKRLNNKKGIQGLRSKIYSLP